MIRLCTQPPLPPAQNEPGQVAREMQEIYCLINISPLPPQKEKVPWSLILDAGFPGNLVGVILIRLCVSNKQKENRALLDPEYSKFITIVKWKTIELFDMKIETFYGTSLFLKCFFVKIL